MNYLTIDKNGCSDHLTKLIDVIFHEVLSAGGDGDVLWYSRFYDINDILPLIKTYNDKLEYKWNIVVKNNTIHWGDNQEWVIITNDENFYNTSPECIQMKIIY